MMFIHNANWTRWMCHFIKVHNLRIRNCVVALKGHIRMSFVHIFFLESFSFILLINLYCIELWQKRYIWSSFGWCTIYFLVYGLQCKWLNEWVLWRKKTRIKKHLKKTLLQSLGIGRMGNRIHLLHPYTRHNLNRKVYIQLITDIRICDGNRKTKKETKIETKQLDDQKTLNVLFTHKKTFPFWEKVFAKNPMFIIISN